MKIILLFLALFFSPLYLISQNWNQIQKVVASDRDVGDQYGQSVSIFGNYAIVGSGWADLTAGAAYILKRMFLGIGCNYRNWYLLIDK